MSEAVCTHDWNMQADKCNICGISLTQFLESILARWLRDSSILWSSRTEIEIADRPKCECGVSYTREGGLHSDWCPQYTKEV